MRALLWIRVGLLYEAVTAAMVGAWALPWPRSFHHDFPGLGMQWAWASGAYNEHYVRDVGALYLGFVVLFVWAALRPTRQLIMATAASWALVQLPHLVWHAAHDENLTSREWGTQTGGLVAMVVVAVALAVCARRISEPAGSAPASG